MSAPELEARAPVFVVLDIGDQSASHELAAATACRQAQRRFAIERQAAAVAERQLRERAAIRAQLRAGRHLVTFARVVAGAAAGRAHLELAVAGQHFDDLAAPRWADQLRIVGAGARLLRAPD